MPLRPGRRLGAAVTAVLALVGAALGAVRAEGLVELVPSPPRSQSTTTSEAPAAAATPVAPPTTLGAPGPERAPYSTYFDGVLRIRVVGERSLGIGTAFAVGDGSWALTNDHVVAGAPRLELETWDGQLVGTATHVGSAPGGQDLALLRLDGGVRPALPLRPDPVAAGERVVTVGYPGGRHFARGVGSVVDRAQSNGRPLLVTDLACEPGCSGSPVLDLEARVVGVIVGSTSDEEVLAIPIEEAAPLLRGHGVVS